MITIASWIFISLWGFSNSENAKNPCPATKENSYKNLPSGKTKGTAMNVQTQNFEVRAFIVDIEKTRHLLSHLQATFKGEYKFTDYIYHPRDREFDLNQEFVRLRVYQQTQWDQKAVELSHKVKHGPGISGHLKIKKQFNTMEEAKPFLQDYRLAFSYQRTGFEYQLDDIRIFLEDVQGLPPSIELVSPSKKNMDLLFEKLSPVQMIADSIPQLIQNSLQQKDS